MRHRLAAGLALLLAIVLVLSGAGGYAASQTAFQLEVAEEKDGQLRVTVDARNLVDVYAFELQFSFDAQRLRLTGATSEVAGFSVPPIVEETQIQIAHTMVGRVAGMDGDAELAVLTFDRMDAGEAVIELLEARLVDSDLEMTVHPVGQEVTISRQGSLVAMSDTAGHWAEKAVAQAMELGFVTGYEDGTFRPQHQVTRAEFAALLVRALQLPVSLETAREFSDHEVIQDWARPYIYAAVEAKLVDGYEDHTFRADQRITRSEMAVMLVRALGERADAAGDEASAALRFADADQIPAWAVPYVSAAVEAGLVQGKGSQRFGPGDDTTRAESVTAILNLLSI
ncbi:S-layer homology domain-containing protein [Paenibacillus sp. 1P07SE]|uniref:S-layer homology domain-containing protein n=1 Tax=Paenibacillus sp. 1P07SE TaxID=3132209 RepID=UPI0039A41740